MECPRPIGHEPISCFCNIRRYKYTPWTFRQYVTGPYPQSNPYRCSASREASGTIFTVFGMTRPGHEPATYRSQDERSTTRPLSRLKKLFINVIEILVIKPINNLLSFALQTLQRTSPMTAELREWRSFLLKKEKTCVILGKTDTKSWQIYWQWKGITQQKQSRDATWVCVLEVSWYHYWFTVGKLIGYQLLSRF